MSQDSNRLSFTIEATASEPSRARATRFKTLHGEVTTPVFMPVGTQATVKTHRPEALLEVGSQVLLANTYHLLLRPGPEVFRKMGGIHKFMNWPRSVLTDSGGFQIFSLPEHRNMTDEGAGFRSHLDGKSILLTPELSIDVQKAIGSDIMMVLDQCVPSTCDRSTAVGAMELTHRWARRSLAAADGAAGALFAIVQGACFADLRRESAAVLSSLPFDGFAVGGLAVGESRSEREDFTELVTAGLPASRPRYLMGVGTPLDILEAVHRGIDMFDCILPTAMAQHGLAYTSQGQLRLRRSVYKYDERPLDGACSCPACRRYSRAYLHHLTKTEEPVGKQLISQHNLHFYLQLMQQIRENILSGRFVDYRRAMREQLSAVDEEHPVTTPKLGRRRVRRATRLGAYALHENAAGFTSVRHEASGEVMHPGDNPDDEAERLYVGQSALAARLTAPVDAGPLVVWDVGLGAAHNAMAALRSAQQAAGRAGEAKSRSLHIVSFDIDLDPLRLALRHPGRFVHLRHAAPGKLLREGLYVSVAEGITWQFVPGDFRSALRTAPLPSVVFYDPFSYKVNPAMWSWPLFHELGKLFAAHAVEIYSYTNATPVRAAMLAAGFFVARGAATGPKSETSIALTAGAARGAGARHELLGRAWLARWERSHARFPADLAASDEAVFCGRIREHVQFAGSGVGTGEVP